MFFLLADALASTGQTAEAIPYFARIIDEFTESEYAEQARTKLAELEATQN